MSDIQLVRRSSPDISGFSEQLPVIIRRIYASRGIENEQQLCLSTHRLFSHQLLNGIQQAVDYLIQYRIRPITIVGDFDCDGATSTALMIRGLKAMGFERVNFIVPNRFGCGYGLTPKIVEMAADISSELIVTVDNGISSVSGVEAAKQHQIPVIITDHHLPGKLLPDAVAIVNHNLDGCQFPSKHLAGVGVAFYLLCALRATMRDRRVFNELQLRPPNLAEWLDLVALGTVADVAVLDSNNRILVHQGLARIRAGMCCAGIQALVEVSSRIQCKLVASDLGFALGPRLNAVGRLDDMKLGIDCLLDDDIGQARRYAAAMNSLNEERKAIEQSMQQEAEDYVAQLHIDEKRLPNALSLYHKDWHQGIIGLVASRIKEQYHRPVFVFANSGDGYLRGSGRSIPGVHLRDLLERIDTLHSGLIDKFGGHAMAAGLSIRHDNLVDFERQLEQVAEHLIDKSMLKVHFLSDGELDSNWLTLDFAEKLRDSGPWGKGFEEPLFDGIFRLLRQKIVGGRHLKMIVQPLAGGPVLEAIAFSVDENCWPNPQIHQVRLAYRLNVNEFRGRCSAQLLVEWLVAQ